MPQPANDEDDLPWDLELDAEGNVRFIWRGEGPQSMMVLGGKDAAGDKLVRFLDQISFGD